MKHKRKLIIAGVLIIIGLNVNSFFIGHGIGNAEKFRFTMVVEGSGDDIKIKTTIYDREWTGVFYKDVVCSKKDKRKTLGQLKRDCKIIIKIEGIEGGEWYFKKKPKSANVKPPELRRIKNKGIS